MAIVTLMVIGTDLRIEGSLGTVGIGAEVDVYFETKGGVAPHLTTELLNLLPGDYAVTEEGDGRVRVVGTAATPSGDSPFTLTLRGFDADQEAVDQTFSLRVIPLPLGLSGSLSAATVGTLYSDTLTVTGGIAPYSLGSIALPDGLSASILGDTITVSGTPTGAGLGPGYAKTYPVSIDVDDSDTGTADFEQTLAITVPTLVATGTAPAAGVDSAYSYTFGSTGGVAGTKTFSSTGDIPDGLTLEADGELHGTPTTADTFAFSVFATDSEGNVSAALPQSVTVAPLWTPADLTSGLYAWYAADNPSNTYGGSEYFTLADLSGNGRTASRSGNGPQVEASGIGGYQCMRFDGTTIQTMQIGSSTGYSQNRAGLTALVTYEMDPDDVSATFRSLMFSATNAANTARFCLASANGTTANVPALAARRVDGTSAEVINAPAQTGPCILVGIADYANADGYVSHNGTLVTDTTFLTAGSTSNTASSSSVRFGTSPDNLGKHKGLILDIVLTTDAVSSADRERLEGWAAWSRGLESLLPIGHTYKTAPPYA